jgi:hypothetical protein
MSKAMIFQISKTGISTYVNTHICKSSSIRKNLKRWTNAKVISVPIDVFDACEGSNQATVDPDMQTKVVVLCNQGRQSDGASFIKQCMMYYHKKHRFVFGEEIMELLNDETTSFTVLQEVFSVTVEPTENSLHYFHKSLLKRKTRVMNVSSTTNTNRIGPFNRYVKEQWLNRREELRAICAGSKSTDVMKLLSSEWRSDPELKSRYS